jgi:hypothetical protein
MPMGQCSECGYSPVAPGAKACPKCGARNPNPSVTDRVVGRSMWIGLAGGALAGGVGGFFYFPKEGDSASLIAGAVAGALTGAIAGFIVGLAVGITLSIVAWLLGKK